jgi:hypothetical protein
MQSETVVLKYEKAESPGAVGFWTGTVLKREMKFVRVFCGLALPQLDRQAAVVVVLGELARSFAPMDLTGLAAATGSWPEVKNALLQFCRDLKPDRIIVQDEPSRKLVFPITDSLIGAPVVPSTYAAPPHSLTELGKQNVDQLFREDRLHVEHLLEVLDSEKNQSDAALRCAINFALEYTAFYPGKKRGPLQYKRILGTEGL